MFSRYLFETDKRIFDRHMDFCSENLDVEEKSIEFDKIMIMKRNYAIFSRWLPNASYVTGIGLSLITRNPTYLLISAAGEVFRFVEIKKGFIYRHLERRMASNRAQLMEDFFEDEEEVEDAWERNCDWWKGGDSSIE